MSIFCEVSPSLKKLIWNQYKELIRVVSPCISFGTYREKLDDNYPNLYLNTSGELGQTKKSKQYNYRDSWVSVEEFLEKLEEVKSNKK